jgi:hypothetical protein
MGFVIQSTTDEALHEDALRRLVEVVDGCRGAKGSVFVVFRNEPPYPAISVHDEKDDAIRKAEKEGVSYFGPVEPSDPEFVAIKKTTGTTFVQFKEPVTRVEVYAKDRLLERFSFNPKGGLTDPQKDIEALFFTPSSVDKYAIPYVTRVYGVEYAAARRREWVKGEKQQKKATKGKK